MTNNVKNMAKGAAVVLSLVLMVSIFKGWAMFAFLFGGLGYIIYQLLAGKNITKYRIVEMYDGKFVIEQHGSPLPSFMAYWYKDYNYTDDIFSSEEVRNRKLRGYEWDTIEEARLAVQYREDVYQARRNANRILKY